MAGRARSAMSVRSTRPASTVPASCRGSVTARRAGEAYYVTKVRQTTGLTAAIPFLKDALILLVHRFHLN